MLSLLFVAPSITLVTHTNATTGAVIWRCHITCKKNHSISSRILQSDHRDTDCIQSSYKASPATMARVRFTKRKAPKNCITRSRAAKATKKSSNLIHHCNENCNHFSEPNVEEILNDEPGQFSPAAPQHSKNVSPCSNAAAHRGPHFICTHCSSLADTYLRNEPHGLLHGGHPARKGQRFFLLCKECKEEAQKSAKQGCSCFDQTLSWHSLRPSAMPKSNI